RLLSPGETVVVRNHFGSGRPVWSDLVASVRLIGYAEDRFHWQWSVLDDSVPALGAIPTLKWVAGSQVWDRHRLTVAAEGQPGQSVTAVLRLYDAFTGRPLPILDERIVQLPLPGIPLGEVVIGNW
ncbi:MAG: hypothetical protein AB1791_05445, partial [Chloroflexota bacterium]